MRLNYQITNKCNLNCKYCYLVEKNKKSREITEKDCNNLINFINKNCKIDSILLTGGEACLNNNILNITKNISIRDIEIDIFTNGKFLEDKYIYLHKFFKNINISLDLNKDWSKRYGYDLQYLRTLCQKIRKFESPEKIKIYTTIEDSSIKEIDLIKHLDYLLSVKISKVALNLANNLVDNKKLITEFSKILKNLRFLFRGKIRISSNVIDSLDLRLYKEFYIKLFMNNIWCDWNNNLSYFPRDNVNNYILGKEKFFSKEELIQSEKIMNNIYKKILLQDEGTILLTKLERDFNYECNRNK